MADKKFNFKTFTSFILVWTFLALIVSGVMLFVSPHGRVAHWSNWTLLGLTKEGWQAVHVLMALVFLIGGIFHLLKFNWKVFVHYLVTKKKGTGHVKEALISAVLFFAVLIGTIIGIPPFSTIIEYEESVKLSWEESEGNPPVPHMEAKTLQEVVGELGLEMNRAGQILESRGWGPVEGRMTLQQLAQANGVSPKDIYEALAPQTVDQAPGGSRSSGRRSSFSGARGMGRMTVGQLSDQLGLDLRTGLREMGIEASRDESWRVVAERAGISPRELLDEARSRLAD
jgi:hypothetical protein